MDTHNLPYHRQDDNRHPSQAILREQQVTPTTIADRKGALVDIGLWSLADGQWSMIMALTRIIEARGWRHE
jgi:hypothetical protein